jgi:hypothetical protein
MKSSGLRLFFPVVLFALSVSISLQGQAKVALDNWFNHESKENGTSFHYLWSDTAFSGYSRWGKIFESKGASLNLLGKPMPKTLKEVDIYIIVDPDTTKENPNPNYILNDDISVITKWVKDGGVLVLLANDAPNCEFTHLNNLASNFGIIFNHVSLHPVTSKQWDMGAYTNLPSHPLFKNVSKIYLKEIASLTISQNAKPVLKDNNSVIMAECSYGKGYVFAVGDPWIYNEYMDHDRLPPDFENRKAAENLTTLLIERARKH